MSGVTDEPRDDGITPVFLGGKWWAHNDACTEVRMPPHIHYGQNVVVVNPRMVPEYVLAEYHILFDDHVLKGAKMSA